MPVFTRKRDVFDFSLDAQDFKQKLWQKLMKTTAAPALEPVEDDDLRWVNAAGSPHQQPDDEPGGGALKPHPDK